MKSHLSYGKALAGSAMKHAAMALVLLLAAAALAPRAMALPIVLDTNNPLANFVREGNQGMTPGVGAMLLTDADPNNHVAFFGATSDAAVGMEVDLTATFLVQSNDNPSGVDTGMRLMISDGAVTSLIVGAVTLGGMPGVAIAIGTNFAGAESWAGFVPVDWLNVVTLRVRRHADGSGEIVEVNGAAPLASTLVPPWSMPWPMLAFPGVGFGLFSDAAVTTAEVIQFSAAAAAPVPEPETYALMLAGLGLLAITARRRKQNPIE